MTKRIALVLTTLLGAAPAFAQAPEPTAPTDPTPTAPQPPTEHVPPREEPPPPPPVAEKPVEKKPDGHIVSSKWDATFYGFVEADTIYDSTQGLFESIGNGAIPRPHTYAGDHGELTYGARNSRIGFKLAAPEYEGMKASAQLEMDFLGNQPGKPFDSTNLVSEGAFFQNPTFRYRHLNVKLETKYVDLLFGQYWELFGWQSYFHPNTVEIQGVPGQVYSRTPQIRISKTIKSEGVNVEVAVAASRDPQRSSATPDGQGGVKLVFNKLKAWHTGGATGSALDGAALGVSGVMRRFAVDEFKAAPSNQVTASGYGVSIDALIPVVPATKENHGNALTFTGSFASGQGIADLYTGLNFGTSQAALPNPTAATPAPTYTSNIDNGLAIFTSDGVLHPVKAQSFILGLQYYLPPKGRAWVSVDYSHISSDNAGDLGGKGKAWTKEDWYSANLFLDVTPAMRLGIEGALYDMTFNDDVEAKNYRFQGSAFFIF